MSKQIDISLLLDTYKIAKVRFQNAEKDFDEATESTVDEALTEFESAGDELANVACAIVDALIDTM